MYLPVFEWAADTGSVAMNTRPKAQPPATMCHQKGTLSNRLVSEPTALSNKAAAIEPSTPLTMMRQDPTCVTIKIKAPIKQANAEVSPIEPGIVPMNDCHQSIPPVVWASI